MRRFLISVANPSLRRSFLSRLLICLGLILTVNGPALVAQIPTATALAISVHGATAATVVQGTVVTMTASVTAGGTAITTGEVELCDAAARFCTDIHILGKGQLTSAGTVIFRVTPGSGTRTYKAVFRGTTTNAASASATQSVSVSARAQATTIATTVTSPGPTFSVYALKATVASFGNTGVAPSGTVQFVDTSAANTVLGSATLASSGPAFSMVSAPAPSVKAQVVTTGDFNNDGHADILAFDGSGNLSVALGNGDGTFQLLPVMAVPYGGSPVIGDFNADGNLDIAVSGAADLGVLLGNGDGTFTLAPSVHGYAGLIVSGDFNGDGKLDLAVTNDNSNTVSILLGKGDGTFTPVAPVNTAAGPGSIVTADFDGDGSLDLAVLTLTDYTVRIYHGNGDGTFAVSPKLAYVGFDLIGMATADVNADGAADLIVTGFLADFIPLLGHGDGTFTQGTSPTSPLTYPTYGDLAIADFNGDGKVDAAVLNANVGGLTGPYLFLGNGDGTFTFSGTFAGLPSTSIATSDLNGDGISDLVFANLSGTTSQPLQQLLLSESGLTATATATGISPIGNGTHQVIAMYTGDANFTGSSSATFGITATPVTPTLTISAGSTPTTFGQPVTLKATLAPFTEPGLSTDGESVLFYSSVYGSYLGSAPLSHGTATLSTSGLYVGTDSVNAEYQGDADFTFVHSAAVPVTVARATPVITWNPPAAATYSGQGVHTLLNATAPVGGSFSYTVTPAGGSPLPLSTASVLGVGTYTLTASFTPYDTTDYVTTSSTTTYTVTPAPLTVVPVNVNRIYGAANPPLPGTVTGALNGDLFTVTGSSAATVASNVGSYPITYLVTGPNLANYMVSSANGVLTIIQAVPSLAWKTPASITYGTGLTATQLNASSSVAGALTYTPAPGAVLPAGTQPLSVVFTPADSTNYASATATTPISVTPAPLTVTALNVTRVYGVANPVFTGTVSGLVHGDSFTTSFATAATVASNVGIYAVKPGVSGPGLPNYNVTSIDGALAITAAGTTTTIALSNGNLTLTATVASMTSGTPTGSVGFYAGQVPIGSATLTNGLASFTAASLPSGDAALSAQYSGDANFTASSATPISLLAVVPSLPSVTVAQSGSATDTLNLTVPSGYVGTVQFSCSGLPANVVCSFLPASIIFNGSASSATTVLTVQTSQAHAATRSAWASQEKSAPMIALIVGPGLFTLYAARRKRSHFGWLFTLFLLCSAGLALSGCGGSSSPSPVLTTPIGDSTFQIIASGPNGLNQTTTIHLTIR